MKKVIINRNVDSNIWYLLPGEFLVRRFFHKVIKKINIDDLYKRICIRRGNFFHFVTWLLHKGEYIKEEQFDLIRKTGIKHKPNIEERAKIPLLLQILAYTSKSWYQPYPCYRYNYHIRVPKIKHAICTRNTFPIIFVCERQSKMVGRHQYLQSI